MIQSALVVGGGLAGLTAAISVAEQGFPAVVVEQSPDLGGNARTLYYTEDGATPAEYVRELIRKVETDPLITIYKDAEESAITGSCGNFTSTLSVGKEFRDISHGVVIVATGGEEYKPSEYLYGQHSREMIQKEFESMLVTEPDTAKRLKRVVMILCGIPGTGKSLLQSPLLYGRHEEQPPTERAESRRVGFCSVSGHPNFWF